MNVQKTVNDSTFLIAPRLLISDIIPLAFVTAAFGVCVAVCAFALFGIPWSIKRGEWMGACVSVAFAVGSAWLCRLALRTVLSTGPRRLEYSRESDAFVITRFGIPVSIPRSRVRAVWPRIEINRGGFKTAPGIWVFLVIQTSSGRKRQFYLHSLKSLERVHRAEIRELAHQFAEFSKVSAGRTEVRE